MNPVLKDTLKSIARALEGFFSVKLNRRFSYLVLIGLIALIEFFAVGLVRRTFLFYSVLEGTTVVEDRMLRRSSSREADIRRYVDEVLLGPVSPDLALLFRRETRLRSLMLRGGVVYADFSQDAAVAPEGVDLFRSFLTINEGIRRNFSSVKDVKLFIGGNEIFFNEFRGIFADPADNTGKPVKRR
ncbi:GerMN domain-containing protein [Leadbettera azotonutricia]|uniref:GerMN domain-containing protein n=1 Tax=Leadbettera azotonutricia (strain ATCC BAA-888 / DSM 13862 / ZAS-9) TaxID=545695 RepID=F5Y6R6_LEAAZ|nr:GerMN domain-containing protein [Leadbettera azotonutricia]AEF80410.1 hypothetical protein TREAZ_1203 [Leadbettera azotonutricia ZAS-9]